MNSKKKKSISARWIAAALIVTVALTFGVTPAWASNPNYRLCFPHTTWFGAPDPRIDGKPDAPGDPDQGWLGGFRYVFGNGTTSPDVILQGVTDGANLYLSIQASNLNLLDTHTFVVLAYDPGNAPDRRRIQVFPVVGAHSPNTQAAAQVEYWGILGQTQGTGTDSSGSTWLGTPLSGASLPPWLGSSNFKVGYQQDPMTNKFSWYLETKLAFATVDPTTAQPDPSTGLLPSATPFFGLYISVFLVKNGNQYQESWWPPAANAQETGCTTTTTCTNNSAMALPNPSTWGTSTVDPTQLCNGVSVGTQPNDITVSNPVHGTGDTIGFGASDPNTFHANVHNNTIDPTLPAPSFATARSVSATWSISSFGLTCPLGLPVCWTEVANTSVATDLPPATMSGSNVVPSTTTLNSNLWIPAAAPADPHQCILVKLDSTPPAGDNTVFVNNAAVQNMQFGTSSTFKRTAVINGKGYPVRYGGNDQLFDLVVTAREEIVSSGQAPGSYRGTTNRSGGSKRDRVISQLTWVAEGCRHTGLYLTEEEEKLELCDPVGAFGYQVRHSGKAPVRKWNVRFSGPGLQPVPGQPNTYQIHVPQDGVATVTTYAEPKEQGNVTQGKFAFFFDAGAGIPHGTFGNFFSTGFSLNTGLEYIATSHFSVEGIFGYHRFPAKIAGDLNLYQFSVNGKAYLTSGTLRPFVNGGVGAYKFSPGPTKFGGNVGGGLLYSLTSRVGLEGAYNFHVINTPGAATKFSTLQGGIRLVF